MRIQFGPLVNFGYEGELIVPIRVAVAKEVPRGGEQSLRLSAKWLICEEICIPDGAELELRPPVAEQAEPTAAAARIERAWAGLPRSWPQPARLAQTGEGDFVLELAASPSLLPDPEVFPADAAFVEHGRGERLWEGEKLIFRLARSPFFERLPEHPRFLLAAGPRAEDPAWWLEAVPAPAAESSATAAKENAAQGRAGGSAWTLWALALLGAFTGGVLLNLMPCVFPVLSLKALAIAESAGEPARLRRHGLLYTLGVLIGFASLGAGLLLLRALGEAVGWGFQLQQSWFVGLLALVMFLLGLSLQGYFAIGTRLMGIGSGLPAMAIAAPFSRVCSPVWWPVPARRLSWARRSAWRRLCPRHPRWRCSWRSVSHGLPLLALSMTPALARRLPRPGAWMESFKQAMAFPLYATALWLLWVLAHQAGPDRMILVLAAALLAVFLIWLGRIAPKWRALRLAGWPLAVLLAAWPGGESVQAPRLALGEPFSETRLAELLAQGRPVLVNMTADWCITCKVNERVALSGERFASALSQHGVHYLVGDFTREDPAIARYLARFGRNGVPLYVLYPAGGGEPALLPQLLTPRLVEEALLRASSSSPSTHP